MARKLEAVQRGEIKRLIVLEPPRHGKSEQVSRLFPAWALGKDPDEQFIACSYNDDTAKDFNRDVQRLMLTEEYTKIFPRTRLNERNVVTSSHFNYQRNSKVFEIVNARGAYRAAGIGGTITGKGATKGIIDDPFKNHEEAYSKTFRNRVWNWYRSTFLTRGEGAFAKGGDVAIVICVTPWHEDDLVGRLLALAKSDPKADQWEVVCLPAVLDADATNGDTREQGDALWPSKYPREHLDRLKVNVGPRDWEALYQCRPTAPDGGTFKREWWKRYDRANAPHFSLMFLSWDMTFKTTRSGSYIVGQVWGVHDADFYLVDQVRFRGDFVETLRAFLDQVEQYPQAFGKLIEDKANGPAIISALSDKIPGILPIQPEGSKEARAASVSPIVSSGHVYLPNEPWVDNEFLPEVAAFPNGAYDDQVDAMTQALAHANTNPILQMEKLVTL